METMGTTPQPLRRVTALYEGRVQGVGFRITTLMTSRRFDVSGYVCNLHDGTVRVVAEWRDDVLRAFLVALKRSAIGRYIDRERLNWAESTGEFDGFDIRHDG